MLADCRSSDFRDERPVCSDCGHQPLGSRFTLSATKRSYWHLTPIEVLTDLCCSSAAGDRATRYCKTTDCSEDRNSPRRPPQQHICRSLRVADTQPMAVPASPDRQFGTSRRLWLRQHYSVRCCDWRQIHAISLLHRIDADMFAPALSPSQTSRQAEPLRRGTPASGVSRMPGREEDRGVPSSRPVLKRSSGECDIHVECLPRSGRVTSTRPNWQAKG